MVDIPHWFRDKNFKLTKDVTKLPPYFYLDWENKNAIYYYTEEDLKKAHGDKIINVSKVKLRDTKDVILLYLNRKYKSILHQKSNKSTNSNKNTISILKSHLQKCVRRRKSLLAVKTANYFIKNKELSTLLRRLVIIVLEDTMLHPDLTVLVWLMMQSKQCEFSPDVNKWILHFVHEIAESNIKDNLETYTEEQTMADFKHLMVDISKLPSSDDMGLLVSMFIRYNYGGMDGDKNTILQYVYMWLRRMKEKDKDQDYKILQAVPRINNKSLECLDNIKELKTSEMLLEAFDFHCCNIVNDIKKEFDMKESEIESLMWNFSSSVNMRQELVAHESDNKIWESMKPVFLEGAKKYRGMLKI